MKTSKQDINDLLSKLAADIEEIKTILNSVAGTGATGKNANAISNDVAVGDDLTPANPNRIIAEINRLLEPIVQTCCKLPSRLKSYYAQILLRIPQDLREELNRDNDTRKCKGLPTVEDKIDNSLTLLVSIYGRLNQLEDAMMPDTLRQGHARQIQSANGKSTHRELAKSGIIVRFQSAWSSIQRLWVKRPARWCRNPYILCTVVIYFLYFGLSIYSCQQWHYYRTENTHLRLAADKYRIDSVIIREIYPQVAITLSAYECITETEGADVALHAFRNKFQELDSKHKSKSKQNPNKIIMNKQLYGINQIKVQSAYG